MEFTFVLLFWVILIVMILEALIFLHTYNVLADSAKEGVRYAIVHGIHNPQGIAPTATTCTAATCPDLLGPPAPPGTDAGYNSNYGVVKTYAQYSLHDVSGMTVAATFPDGTTSTETTPPNRVQIAVSYPYQPLFGLGWPTITVYAAAEGRIMN